MGVAEEIRSKLTDAFTPTSLDVINESHKHAGHSGDDGTGESHFRIAIAAPAFADMSRVARHRAVYGALGKDLTDRVHAIALDISG
ncbi:MAG: BolA family protein [Pseudomonadota bacterium]